ncbi:MULTISPECIES: DUF423 domain-containing protein [Myxococcus]|uniref:DUF423 domain-containing protein n=1 Tax=Myxococcus llanfairpwllgwyngyllgogerychwyrndrobwllllantysiliogogogochensis TaxID=2590453 RepID=A0A540X3D3_9BACT|nr:MULTISPECIES: DUF423 domain-containing protein [Myxococcus]NTX04377.1 DUF423 domain-containing protein [Myxococcus sp. CA040A]NTX50097.1 DUF423 domain-containing protein [Myxococcus sp. CA039A]TQF15756.1 DUF423 domain-containing protein [Myxococcus llanfairpwllgwyngyllgogerychwyrndrobwllllantysiliogogogochensis]
MMRWWLVLGAVNAFLSVAAGAFGAHALKARLPPDLLVIFETGARYHMYHALGLLAVGLLALLRPSSLLNGAGWAMLVGIVLFSGSLYALALSGVRVLGAVTPLGGLGFLAGWALFAIAAWRATP